MSAAKASGAAPPKARGGGLWLRLRRWCGTVAWGAYRGDNPGILIGAMLILIAIFAYLLRDTGFMSPINLLSIVRVSTTITIMAIAIVFVLCAGEIDLSIAAVVPVSALITAVLLSWDYNFVVAALAGVLFGAAVGLMNGLAVVFFKIPSFVVTLGSMGIMQGLAQIVTNASTVSIADELFPVLVRRRLDRPGTGPGFLVAWRVDHWLDHPLPYRHGATRPCDGSQRRRGALFRRPDWTCQNRSSDGERRRRGTRGSSLRWSVRSRQFHHRRD